MTSLHTIYIQQLFDTDLVYFKMRYPPDPNKPTRPNSTRTDPPHAWPCRDFGRDHKEIMTFFTIQTWGVVLSHQTLILSQYRKQTSGRAHERRNIDFARA